MINLYHSRRGHFRPCKWFKRDERNSVADLSTLVYNTLPSGVFYAKEITPISNQKDQTNNVFMYDKNFVTLETSDNVEELKSSDIVLYRNEKWIVTDVQAQIHNKETEYCQNNRGDIFIIGLRK